VLGSISGKNPLFLSPLIWFTRRPSPAPSISYLAGLTQPQHLRLLRLQHGHGRRHLAGGSGGLRESWCLLLRTIPQPNITRPKPSTPQSPAFPSHPRRRPESPAHLGRHESLARPGVTQAAARRGPRPYRPPLGASGRRRLGASARLRLRDAPA